MFTAFFTDNFKQQLLKLEKRDPQLKQRLRNRIDEMVIGKPFNPTKYTEDLMGKYKARVGIYRMVYVYCEDCRQFKHQKYNKCYECNKKADGSIIFFAVFHRSKGYKHI